MCTPSSSTIPSTPTSPPTEGEEVAVEHLADAESKFALDPDLIDDVVRFSANDVRVIGMFEVNSRIGKGVNARPRQTFALVSIEELPPAREPLM